MGSNPEGLHPDACGAWPAHSSGIRDLSQGTDLRVKPFLTSGFRSQRFRDSSTPNEFLRDAGLDMKYGVTSGLNLDITLNTDFAQVEVDEQQVNLTRFGLFFPRSAISSWRTPDC